MLLFAVSNPTPSPAVKEKMNLKKGGNRNAEYLSLLHFPDSILHIYSEKKFVQETAAPPKELKTKKKKEEEKKKKEEQEEKMEEETAEKEKAKKTTPAKGKKKSEADEEVSLE